MMVDVSFGIIMVMVLVHGPRAKIDVVMAISGEWSGQNRNIGRIPIPT